MDHLQVIDLVNVELEKAVQKYGVTELRNTQITIKPMGSCIGRAARRDGKYHLFLDTHHVDTHSKEDILSTIIHEIAHLVCYIRPDLGRNHDRGWKRVCISLGGDGKRTTDLEVQYLKQKTIKRYVYSLLGKEYPLAAKAHEHVQSRPVTGVRIIPGDRTPSVILYPSNFVRVDSYTRDGSGGAVKKIEPKLTTTDFSGMSKVEACKVILQQNPDITRGAGIELFMKHLGMSKAGASTYYQNLKKAARS